MEDHEEDSEKEDDSNQTCYNPVCNQSMDSVTKELAEATQRIRILKRQLAKSEENGSNHLIYRPLRGDTILQHHKRCKRTYPAPAPHEIETVL